MIIDNKNKRTRNLSRIVIAGAVILGTTLASQAVKTEASVWSAFRNGMRSLWSNFRHRVGGLGFNSGSRGTSSSSKFTLVDLGDGHKAKIYDDDKTGGRILLQNPSLGFNPPQVPKRTPSMLGSTPPTPAPRGILRSSDSTDGNNGTTPTPLPRTIIKTKF